MSYVELHTCSAFSFLEGASLPEQLVQEAALMGYPALALLDRDGLYGAPRFQKAARDARIRPLLGAEVSIEGGLRLPLLVENRTGYQNLCRLITRMKLRSEKGKGELALAELEEFSSGLVCLTGGEKGPLHVCLEQGDPEKAQYYLQQLKFIFGASNIFIELQRHFDRKQERNNQFLIDWARHWEIPLVGTNGVRYARTVDRLLMDVLTCIRHKTCVQQAGKLLHRNAEARLKTPQEMSQIFATIPEALVHAHELSQRLTFTLEDLGYQFPEYPTPQGEPMIQYLRRLTEQGARNRYRPYHERARRQIAHELQLIEKLNLAGYFLIVWDLVRFCEEHDILVQGRGSAANSAVCYSLGITAVDPIKMDLLFERFLSEERGEWPDIDLDLPSGDRRERVIQYMYERYGTRGSAMTANVITYRGRSAAREVGKALGFPLKTLDRLSKLFSSWPYDTEERSADNVLKLLQQFRQNAAAAELRASPLQLEHFLNLWLQIQDLPRHLGQHSGGMVIAHGSLDSIVPLEKAAMPGRVVVQWDKDDCADLGMIKVDLLGLGMMSALQDALKLIRTSGREISLAHLPPDDPAVFKLLQEADTVGVFQVESRAQMATLPRLKPENFYDLVVEIAIIRPGPIVGQMVHPYLKRRAGLEPVTYPHPCLEAILKRTLGVPLFQEQLLRMAMAAAGFSGGEAEELRRALGSKRSAERMHKIEIKLRAGMSQRGITGEAAETIVRSITSFALYGFPESHAASFALIAYASAYFKVHFPNAFYASLLNNQPMGFYHPATLVKDAQHRGVRIKPVDVQKSDWLCTIEEDQSLRLGLMYVAGLREQAGKKIEEERRKKIFHSLEDLKKRTSLNKLEITTLAEIGSLNSLGMKRREALWQVAKTWRYSGPLGNSWADEEEASPLPDMTARERLIADYAGMGLTIGPHPLGLKRPQLRACGALRAVDLRKIADGKRVRVAGGVIVRQQPGTAGGFVFLSLEDESGIANIIVHPRLVKQQRPLLANSSFLLIEGILQNQNGVTSVRAEKFWPFEVFNIDLASHDFY